MRYTLDIYLEVDGVGIHQRITNLTEGGMENHVAEVQQSPAKIIRCIPSKYDPAADVGELRA